MSTTHPVMTFKCPRCGGTEDLYVSPTGQVQFTSRGAGMAPGIDYENPRNSGVLCGCSEDEMGEKTEMKKIREREFW
jgi:hypothetical protein